jgi:beta-glucosidase
MTAYSFHDSFLWGAATASYQIEGAWDADGKGESIWDRFSHTPGKVYNGDTGDIACDHYHRYPDDIAIMQRLGLHAYRFSLSWPRVVPRGRGEVNPAGLDFYDRLVDALLAASIQPFATLYHWDLPQALQDEGGWGNRATCDAFAEYAGVVAGRLGDRVRAWMTINEPQVIAFLGHRDGEHAPGLKDERLALQAAHHLLIAHGLAAQAIRANRPDVSLGIVLNLWPVEAATDAPADRAEAEVRWRKDNAWFLDPLFYQRYPQASFEAYGPRAPVIQPGDWALIGQPLDFLGVNYYTRTLVTVQGPIAPVPGAEYTEMGWEVHAPALRRLLLRLKAEYPPIPLYITENGGAFPDEVSTHGRVHDPRRIAYLRDHFIQAQQAMAEGVDLRGYFVWSLLDNFEWAHGYSKRFGLVYVDYATPRRIVKDSGEWYARVIAQNAVSLAAS